MTESRQELDRFFPYRLAVAAERFSRNLTEVYGGDYGLSREEWRLLFLLAGNDRITSRELTRRTTLDKVQVSRAAGRLEEKGLITRAVEQSDRRLKVYACTMAGQKLFAEILPKVEARAQTILTAMSNEERMALDQGLTSLSDAMDGM